MKRFIVLCFLILGANSVGYVHAQADERLWTRLVGSNNLDEGNAVAVDLWGNNVIAGATQGNLFATNAGRYDMFVAKYDPDGNLLWGRQRGTDERDFAFGVATDSQGNVYATGYAAASLDGEWHVGNRDIFLMKFSPTGNWLWTRQIGTAMDDEGFAVTTDPWDNVFITGYVRGDMHGQTRIGKADAFVSKYNAFGTRLWTRLLGSVENDEAWGIACDAWGNVFITGWAAGPIDGQPHMGSASVFLAKYDNNGNRLWVRQWGTWNAEHGYSLATDAAGNVYVSGYTTGALYGSRMGGRDVFLAKFDANGNALWGRQFGTDEHDQGWGVAMGADGNVYLAGAVAGPIYGNPYAGGLDVFLAKYNPAGTRLWMTVVGTSANEWARGVATTADGAVFLAGTTGGHLDGNQNHGGTDAFIMKFGPAPPPPPVVVDAGPDKYILLDRSTLLEGAVSGGTPPYAIQWSPTEGLDNPQLLEPTASPTVTTLYTLTVTDSQNVSDSDSVLVTVSPSNIPGDLDGDGDVDQVDFGLFQACYTGPDVPQDDPACIWARLDDDDDVDADDLAIFLGCFTGANVPGDPDCAGPFAPEITQNPANQSVDSGETATFTVAASGTTPLSYQWQKDQVDLVDGGNISGATTHTLQISDCQIEDQGDYRCVVTNNHGSATSNAASLEVYFDAPPLCFTNHDLETYTAGVATGWAVGGDAADVFASTDSYSGNYSQEIRWTTAGRQTTTIYQQVWVEVGVPYTIEAYFRMNNTDRVNGWLAVDFNGGTDPTVVDIGTNAPRLDWGSKALTFTKTSGEDGWATVFVGGYGSSINANDWCRVDFITPACD